MFEILFGNTLFFVINSFIFLANLHTLFRWIPFKYFPRIKIDVANNFQIDMSFNQITIYPIVYCVICIGIFYFTVRGFQSVIDPSIDSKWALSMQLYGFLFLFAVGLLEVITTLAFFNY